MVPPLCSRSREVIALEEVGVISNLDQSAFEQWVNLHQNCTGQKLPPVPPLSV